MPLLLALLGLSHSFCAAAPSHLEQANHLYEQGKYDEAISLYSSMIKGGHNSPAVYFNLGNACFKQGALGHALASYLQAERLAPRDPDIQANLAFTRDRVVNSVSIPSAVMERLFTYFTLDELAAAAALLFWVWALLIILTRLRPARMPQFRGAGLAVGSLLGLTLIVLAVSVLIQNRKTAIVTAKQATVHLGPFPESQNAFTATDGTELRILSERPDWLQVSDRTHRTGWVAATNAVIFAPVPSR